jgi:hypothetical protein
VEETIDLTNAMSTFDFVFRLYNFVSLANGDNNALRDPFRSVAKLHVAISNMRLSSLTTKNPRKRKTRVDDDAGNGPSKKARNDGGPVESDIVSDVVILEALKRAGYTIPDEDERFELLIPVRVSFP